jgi:hypothetical protein
MGSHKHHMKGQAGPSRWQKYQWARDDNAIREAGQRAKPKMFATLREAMEAMKGNRK